MRDANLELDALLARLVDETITNEELAQLEEQLDSDPDAQRRYLHYLDLHADLVQAAGGEESRAMARPHWRNRRFAAGLAATAAVMMAALFIFRDAPAPVIRLVDLEGPVKWMDGSGNTDTKLKAGLELSSGTWESLTADSWVELAFQDGTSISLAGQSALTISIVDGQKVLRLREGNLSIKAVKQPRGQPLKVFTPSAEAEVLGTQFNVRADAYSSRFVVNEGLVQVTRLADGRIEEVSADQVVVAALEQDTEFTARPRRAFVESWQSVLPRDGRQGRWEPASSPDLPGGLRAMPHLWRGESGNLEKPVLLYTAVFDPSAKRMPPFRLADGVSLRVRGRLDDDQRVSIGFATRHSHGGFSGKYSLSEDIMIKPDEGGRFQFERGLDAFSPKKKRFPESPAGHEVLYLWIQTVEVDAGLVIEHVEWSK